MILSDFAIQYREARVVRMLQGLALIPLTDLLYDSIVAGKTTSHVQPFERLSTLVADALSTFSKAGKIAYVETDYFGGEGAQSSAVWERGELILPPRQSSTDDPGLALGERAINAALRKLGAVSVEGAVDLFDSIGLGNFRSTEFLARNATQV
ncbi:hypothetical protein [Burkholderia sp. LMG 21824]|uniref:hypothetical protein n=1 Tax=Burkholderia sp. LMG 21824 TaxID=3158172 RepID=UPI003C2D82CD